MTSHRPLRALAAALCAAAMVAGCANSSSVTGQPAGLAGRPQGPGPAPPAAMAEPPPEVPPGPPSPSYAYRGGRDPLTGQATIVEGAAEPLTLGPDGNPIQPKAVKGPGKGPSKPLQRAAAPAPAGGSVVVQKGDSLFRIAQRHRVTVAALMAANGLAGPNIVPGQRLVIPR